MCCKKARDQASEQAHHVDASLSSDEEYTMYTIGSKTTKPFIVNVELDGVHTNMEVDTGASVSIMSEERFTALQDKVTVLRSSGAKLVTYTGESINVVSAAVVTVKYNEQVATLPLIITSGTGPSLLGWDWLSALKLDWKEIFVLQSPRSLQDVLDAHQEVFANGLGTVQSITATIDVDPDATPLFHKVRPLPYTKPDHYPLPGGLRICSRHYWGERSSQNYVCLTHTSKSSLTITPGSMLRLTRTEVFSSLTDCLLECRQHSQSSRESWRLSFKTSPECASISMTSW